MEMVLEPVCPGGVSVGVFPMSPPRECGGPLEWSPRQFAGIQETLRASLGRQLRDPNEMEDVIGETYLRAVRYQARLRDPEKVRGWLLQISRNVLADRKRLEQRWVTCSFGEDPETAGEILEPAEEPAEDRPALAMGAYRIEEEDAAAILEQEVARMPESDRRLLHSFYGGSESCREAAAEVGVPVRLVKVRLFRARRRLCRALRHRLAISHANPEVRAGVSRVAVGGAA
ncbi:MAG TPA: sigma-70 family RNA polymerase sigma factor [Planctomycetes bacterium]|nr:sigma-70 family RNA polymerase sigma factor [Planctomycetota bacterium]